MISIDLGNCTLILSSIKFLCIKYVQCTYTCICVHVYVHVYIHVYVHSELLNNKNHTSTFVLRL